MAANIFTRLRRYYRGVARDLAEQAGSAAVFRNSSDLGDAREKIYADFLRQHAPSRCNVFLGGFLFDEDGAESNQLDIIVTNNTTPQFKLRNSNEVGKSFSPVEGTLGVVSVKSRLDKERLFEALSGIASIPPTRRLDGRIPPNLKIKDYDDWPLRVIYASSGISGKKILEHVKEFFATNPHIPVNRQPHVIHVVGKFAVIRMLNDMILESIGGQESEKPEVDTYRLFEIDPDLHAILLVLRMLQNRSDCSKYIMYNYDFILNKTLDTRHSEHMAN